MKKSILTFSALGLAMAAAPAMADDDDRQPSMQERAAIEKSVKAAGYVSWEEVEFDDGMWEVDDARRAGSNVDYDLKLDPNSYDITASRED